MNREVERPTGYMNGSVGPFTVTYDSLFFVGYNWHDLVEASLLSPSICIIFAYIFVHYADYCILIVYLS